MTNRCASLFQLALLLVSSAAGVAQTDHVTAFTGTWKLNLAKSTYPSGEAPQNLILNFAPDGKTSASGTMASGEPLVWSFSWSDGKEVPVDGMMAKFVPKPTFTQIFRGKTCDAVLKSAGKTVITIHSTLSADGKTQTAVVTELDEKAHQSQHKEVYEKK